jgi:hypothetical protein
MIAAILIWASQKKGDEGPKQNNNNESMNYATKTTSQRAQPSIPEYLIIAWLCGNIHKLLLSVLNLKTVDFYLFMSKCLRIVTCKHTNSAVQW